MNDLLRVARQSAPTHSEESQFADVQPPVAQTIQESVGADDIAKHIEQLKGNKYAGKGLIPIHAVRRLVAEHHGEVAAGHPTFDPLLKRMRSEGQLELIAINDKRVATEEELDASIPGMNETIFFIVVD